MKNASLKKENNNTIKLTNTKITKYLLTELKAKVDDLQEIRNKIVAMTAKPVGTFRQIDTYFQTPKGRLKFREINGSDKVTLIYYEREDIAGPKKSDVSIVEIQRPLALYIKRLLDKALGVKAVVDKLREVYRYQGIQIHLDTVKELGTFVEFEKDTPKGKRDVDRGCRILRGLMEKIGIRERNLERQSYCDLVSRRTSTKEASRPNT